MLRIGLPQRDVDEEADVGIVQSLLTRYLAAAMSGSAARVSKDV
jgi:hypothetical protein